jgi:hypothetical protein
MVDAAPRVVSSRALEDEEARQLWNWLLRRQGLAEDTRLDSAVAIAYSALGLHSARLPSPFSTVLARGTTPAVALSLFSPATRAQLMTVRCMRKTLHSLPLRLAEVAHAATVHFRERDALRAITVARMGARRVSRITDAILDVLTQSGPLPCRDIETVLVGRRMTTTAVRLALKLAWERGLLVLLNDFNGWNRQHRKFAPTSTAYPGLDMLMDKREATGELVRQYFDRYGPASLRDAAWWSGLSRAAITTALDESSREVVAITGSWCDSPMYMYLDRFEQFRHAASTEQRTGLNLLAHEDVAIKAYFESRRRYLGGLPPMRAFNQIGEALPTILLDGQVAGTWAWEANRRAVTFSIAREFSSPGLRGMVKKQGKAISSPTAGPRGGPAPYRRLCCRACGSRRRRWRS